MANSPTDTAKRSDGSEIRTRQIFWRLKTLTDALNASKSFIYAGIKAGTFPKPVKLGRASVWVASEIESWAAARVAERAN